GPAMLAQRDLVRDLRLIIVDDSSSGFGEAVADQLRAAEGVGGRFEVSVSPGPLAPLSDSLGSLVQEGRLDAYMHIPPAAGDPRSVTIWSEDALRNLDRSRLRSALTSAAQRER